MKSQGEIEAAVCDGISRFQQEFIGRGPRDIHAHLIGTLLVVRLQGVLTPAERQLISPRPGLAGNGGSAADAGAGNGHSNGNAHGNGDGHAHGDNGNGRALLKQVRSHMVASGRPRLEEIVRVATGVGMVSVHHDISTVTGEEVIVFSLTDSPACRQKKSAK